jgi:hypothetical protein
VDQCDIAKHLKDQVSCHNSYTDSSESNNRQNDRENLLRRDRHRKICVPMSLPVPSLIWYKSLRFLGWENHMLLPSEHGQRPLNASKNRRKHPLHVGKGQETVLDPRSSKGIIRGTYKTHHRAKFGCYGKKRKKKPKKPHIPGSDIYNLLETEVLGNSPSRATEPTTCSCKI